MNRGIKCEPCAGSGKRHSIFDDCHCVPECTKLGVCGNCNGTGHLTDDQK